MRSQCIVHLTRRDVAVEPYLSSPCEINTRLCFGDRKNYASIGDDSVFGPDTVEKRYTGFILVKVAWRKSQLLETDLMIT